MNIGEMQRSLSRKAEQNKKHRFDNLFNLTFHPEWLRLAHDHVASNAGSQTAGCDGIRMADFDEELEGNLQGLIDSLRSGSFKACPVRRVYIPKANGKRRPLGIASLRDRIVQEAVRMILEPIFEADFRQDSYGFRPCRCTMDAAVHLWAYLRKGYHWIIEGDISSYFDTINHRKLMKLLKRRVADDKLLNLIWGFLPKVTHLQEGFDFLGFHFQWERATRGMAMMTSISERSMTKHLEFIKATTSASSLKDAVGAKLIALHRTITGWCRYFQYTTKVTKQFRHLAHVTLWRFARWLAAKERKHLSQIWREYSARGTMVISGLSLTLHSRFKRLRYARKPHKPNPYLSGEKIEREELLDDTPWTGSEVRPGQWDYRQATLERDQYRCQMCGKQVTPTEAEVDHRRRYSCFKRHENANRQDNLWTLCRECHRVKTESDR